jgi:hypothetical protein
VFFGGWVSGVETDADLIQLEGLVWFVGPCLATIVGLAVLCVWSELTSGD